MDFGTFPRCKGNERRNRAKARGNNSSTENNYNTLFFNYHLLWMADWPECKIQLED
jgi:hypothetical protein